VERLERLERLERVFFKSIYGDTIFLADGKSSRGWETPLQALQPHQPLHALLLF
jgi:hypothetical protein